MSSELGHVLAIDKVQTLIFLGVIEHRMLWETTALMCRVDPVCLGRVDRDS